MIVKTCENKDCNLPFTLSNKDRKSRKFCSVDCYHFVKRKRSFENKPYPEIRVNGKKVYLHRHIYEQTTGETLTTNDIIHHIDNNPFNRNPDNLEKLSGKKAHLHVHNYHKNRRGTYAPDDEIPF